MGQHPTYYSYVPTTIPSPQPPGCRAVVPYFRKRTLHEQLKITTCVVLSSTLYCPQPNMQESNKGYLQRKGIQSVITKNIRRFVWPEKAKSLKADDSEVNHDNWVRCNQKNAQISN